MKKVLILLMMLMGIIQAHAKEAYGVLIDGTLTIYYDDLRDSREGDTFDMYKKSNTPAWFSTEVIKTITKVVFDSSVTDYRPTCLDFLFHGFSNLSEIVGIEHLNTSLVIEMAHMFDSCSSLTSLDVTNFNTSNVTDMSGMFNFCSSLTDLDVSHFNTSNVTYMYDMFHKCSGLTNLDVTNFDTSCVEDMFYMFGGCSSLTNLDVTNFNTSNVTRMDFMFDNCSSLTNLDVSHFNTSNVTDMSGMFNFCSSLTDLDVSHFNTSNVTSMDYMFGNCSSLTNLDVNNFDTSCVEDMGGMFHNCKKIALLDVSHFNTNKVTRMSWMFSGCESLSSLDLTNFNTEKVTEIVNMFDNSLKILILGKNFTTISQRTFYSVTNLITLTLLATVPCEIPYDAFNEITQNNTFLIVPKNTKSLYEVSEGWKSFVNIIEIGESVPYAVVKDKILTFYFDEKINKADGQIYSTKTTRWIANNPKLTKIVFDSSFINYTPYDISLWFSNMSTVTEIDGLKYLNTSKVTNMAQLFYCCNSLTSIDLSHFNTSNVTNMAHLFSGCSSLTNLDVNNFDTSNVTDMSAMFSGCSSLTNLDVTNFNTSNVTNMAHMFRGCSSLTSIDLSHFNTSNVTEMSCMFMECSSLKGIILNNFCTQNVTAMVRMFSKCYNLESIDMSTFNTSGLDTNQPYRCTYAMFEHCIKLNSITIGKLFTLLSNYTFAGCTNLRTINSNVENPFAFSNNVFDDVVYNNATLNVPNGTKSLYQSTDGWKKFKSIVEGGGDNTNQDLEPIDEDDNTDYGNGDINNDTDLSGNVVGNIYYNIADGNGEYSSTEGCITLRKSTTDSDMNDLVGKDIFGEDFKNGFTGIVFMVQAGQGTVKVNAESVGNMTLKVKFGNNAPVTMELEGKMKASFPYSVSEPTYVYIYGGETQTANAKGLRAASSNNALKIYGIEWSDEYEASNIESVLDNINSNAIIYNLQGQRLRNATKGINIINGKKVIVK